MIKVCPTPKAKLARKLSKPGKVANPEPNMFLAQWVWRHARIVQE
jgi:hypothetical protein